MLRNFLIRNSPIIFAALLLWVFLLIEYFALLVHSDGQFVYVLDDAYIHMATAKNLVDHGIWGVTQYGFTSATSSILWPLLLALAYFVGLTLDYIPIALNMVFAIALLVLADGYFKQQSLSHGKRFVALLALACLTPLPALVFSGMEHILQTIAVAVFFFAAAQFLATPGPKKCHLLALTALFVAATRYEGMFAVAPIIALLMFRRHWFASLWVTTLASLPIVIFGLVSVQAGWPFLPASVVVKGYLLEGTPENFLILPFLRLVSNSLHAPYWLILWGLVTTVSLRVFRQSPLHVNALIGVFLGATGLLHMAFARPGWFYRYDAYLVAIGIGCLVVYLSNLIRSSNSAEKLCHKGLRPLVFFVLLAITGALLGWRGFRAAREISGAAQDMHLQQSQMAQFTKRFYNGDCIVANDVGQIAYFTEARIIDPVGLAFREILLSRIEKSFSAEKLSDFTNQCNASIGIFYDEWLRAQITSLPANWRFVGSWKIPDTTIAAYDEVAFYAFDPVAANILRSNLADYRKHLPNRVSMKLLSW